MWSPARPARLTATWKMTSPAWPRNCPPTTPPALRIAASRISARLYHLQRGVQSRFGVPVYLALLTMSPAQNADPAETGSTMEQLGELIHKSLRQCDAMARYSENQYVLLISGNSSAENGSTPLERIKAAFYRMPAHGRYLLNYHMYAPELHALSADARRR